MCQLNNNLYVLWGTILRYRAKIVPMAKKVERLFSQFKPVNYKIDLTPDSETMTFTGTVIITGHKVGRPSKRLAFHQNGLTITKAHVVHLDKKGHREVVIDRINHHKTFNEVRLHAQHMLYPGMYTVTFEFTGTITRNMNGMYPCFFKHNSVDKKLIATQFESHHAREVFPCIDEPEAKATFDLTLQTPVDVAVLANTPESKHSVHNDVRTTVFETTPIMSTYLLAFVYGDMGHLEAKTKSGVRVRTYATPDNVAFTEFALDIAVRCLEFYENYFNIDYPLAKCDFIALPDFASGAMENWGCITFREQALLVDPENTSLSSKQYVAMVVAHELTHQWFGNLVTMKWWTDLWLNEGFATWMSYLAMDELYPEWHIWTQFIVDEQQQAMKLDALVNTHPIEVPINHPDEIRTIFDAISYEKGASVIHMLHDYLGPHDFREGMRYYLKKHQYSNTITNDLWDALEEISQKPVREFMNAWTSKPGFPLLHATIANHTVKTKQERFYVNPLAEKVSDVIWPISVRASDDSIQELLVEHSHDYHDIDASHLKLNHQQGGFYRVAYNATHLNRLGELIEQGHLSPIDRLGVLSDLFETAKAGYSDTVDALDFLKHFKNEDNYAVWDIIAGAIGAVRQVMDTDEIRESIKPYVRAIVQKQLDRLGWEQSESDSHFDKLLRPIILGLAASADDKSVLQQCQTLFETITFNKDGSPNIPIDPDIRGIVLTTIARRGNEKIFDQLLAMHNGSTQSEDRLILTSALTSFKQKSLIERSLSIIQSEDVRLQDVAYWVAYSMANRHAKQITWDWVRENWDWLANNLGTDLSFFRMPIYVARVMSDASFIPEYRAFFEPKLNPSIDRTFKQGIEMIEWSSAWKKRALKETSVFLTQRQK